MPPGRSPHPAPPAQPPGQSRGEAVRADGKSPAGAGDPGGGDAVQFLGTVPVRHFEPEPGRQGRCQPLAHADPLSLHAGTADGAGDDTPRDGTAGATSSVSTPSTRAIASASGPALPRRRELTFLSSNWAPAARHWRAASAATAAAASGARCLLSVFTATTAAPLARAASSPSGPSATTAAGPGRRRGQHCRGLP